MKLQDKAFLALLATNIGCMIFQVNFLASVILCCVVYFGFLKYFAEYEVEVTQPEPVKNLPANVMARSEIILGKFMDEEIPEWIDVSVNGVAKRFTYFNVIRPERDGSFVLPIIEGKQLARVGHLMFERQT